MGNFQEQELSLPTCIIAIMQKEERPDSRNRQAAGNDRGQNEVQIWQRARACGNTTGGNKQPKGEAGGQKRRELDGEGDIRYSTMAW
jgi:hypothetical protein